MAVLLGAYPIKFYLIREEDPPYSGQATAIGIDPRDGTRAKQYLSKLKLFAGDKRKYENTAAAEETKPPAPILGEGRKRAS